jgi:hypothetical protein
MNMDLIKVVILGIFIICNGATSISAEARTQERVSGTEEATVAADTTASSPNDSTCIETSSPLAGRWRVAETADEKDRRLQAIDEVTEDLGRFKRGKARSRLAERTSPPPTVMIAFMNSSVTITSGDRRLELELGGDPIEVSGDEGTMQMSAKMEGERLIVMARGDKAERTTSYRTDGTGLSMEVTLTNDNLAGPLKYITTYTCIE